MYFSRALKTFPARCATIITPAVPVNTTYPYSLEKATILTNLKEEIQHGWISLELFQIKSASFLTYFERILLF